MRRIEQNKIQISRFFCGKSQETFYTQHAELSLLPKKKAPKGSARKGFSEAA